MRFGSENIELQERWKTETAGLREGLRCHKPGSSLRSSGTAVDVCVHSLFRVRSEIRKHDVVIKTQ